MYNYKQAYYRIMFIFYWNYGRLMCDEVHFVRRTGNLLRPSCNQQMAV